MKKLLSLLVVGSLVASVGLAETDYVAMKVIDDIQKGKNTPNQIVDLRVQRNATIGGTLSVAGAVSQTVASTVPNGGTGLATITDHAVMVGSGTGAVTPLAVGSNNQVLRGATGADPAFGALVDADIPDDITISSVPTSIRVGVFTNDASGAATVTFATLTTAPRSIQITPLGATAQGGALAYTLAAEAVNASATGFQCCGCAGIVYSYTAIR